MHEFERGVITTLIALGIAIAIAATAYEAGRAAPRNDCAESDA